MSEQTPQRLSDEQVDELTSEELPDREQMSLINAQVAAPIDAAVAANVLTNESTADAENGPDAPIDQTVNR
jgi:hypothetical protein